MAQGSTWRSGTVGECRGRERVGGTVVFAPVLSGPPTYSVPLALRTRPACSAGTGQGALRWSIHPSTLVSSGTWRKCTPIGSVGCISRPCESDETSGSNPACLEWRSYWSRNPDGPFNSVNNTFFFPFLRGSAEHIHPLDPGLCLNSQTIYLNSTSRIAIVPAY